MADHISNYSEDKVKSRAPGLCYPKGYYKSESDGLVEIGYTISIHPLHYAWLWVNPITAATLAIVDASKNGNKHFFDGRNGELLGSDISREEAREKLNRRKAEERERERQRLQKIADEKAAAERERQRLQKIADEKAAAERERERLQKIADEKAAAERERERLQKIADKKAAAERERERLQKIADEKAAAERERERLQKIADEKAAAERERERLQKIADEKAAAERERQRLQQEAEEKAAHCTQLLTQGSSLILSDKYEEALGKLDQLLLSYPENTEALQKRRIAQNILSAVKSYDQGDEELQAASASSLEKDYEKALSHYRKALYHFQSARKDYEEVAKGDSRFQRKIQEVDFSISDLHETIQTTEEALEGESEEDEEEDVELDIDFQEDEAENLQSNLEDDQELTAETESTKIF